MHGQLRYNAIDPNAKMAYLFPNFSLGFDFNSDVFCDLENEYENELLASMDLEDASNTTNNSMTESEISQHVMDENSEAANSNIRNNQRFLNMSSAKIYEIITRAETKKNKENTK